ncbi:hypothetical protein ACTOSX_14525 [Bacillus subtilis]
MNTYHPFKSYHPLGTHDTRLELERISTTQEVIAGFTTKKRRCQPIRRMSR